MAKISTLRVSVDPWQTRRPVAMIATLSASRSACKR